MPENTPEEMPGAIAMSVQYASYGAFERGQAEMAKDGWTLEGYTVGEPGGLFRRRPVEARYLRDEWPVE